MGKTTANKKMCIRNYSKYIKLNTYSFTQLKMIGIVFMYKLLQ